MEPLDGPRPWALRAGDRCDARPATDYGPVVIWSRMTALVIMALKPGYCVKPGKVKCQRTLAARAAMLMVDTTERSIIPDED